VHSSHRFVDLRPTHQRAIHFTEQLLSHTAINIIYIAAKKFSEKKASTVTVSELWLPTGKRAGPPPVPMKTGFIASLSLYPTQKLLLYQDRSHSIHWPHLQETDHLAEK
jgi:hypothetical protein